MTRVVLLLCLLGSLTPRVGVAADAAGNQAFALLVGVSQYPALSSERQLQGPRQDVQVMRDVLRAVRPDWRRIAVLADSVTGAQGLPTRQAIFDAMAQLERNVAPGDFAVVYFAGHGSQQPSTDVGETDGLDEIFLPRDIGAWDGRLGRVRNAITDNEIDTLLGKLLAQGAQVWAIFDTCHSGTMTRGSGSLLANREKPRWIRPVELGIPISSLGADARLPGGNGQAKRDVRSGLTVFSASQSFETTPELRLPPGDPDRLYRGLFTYALAESLAASGPSTYEQLAQRILTRYASMNRISPTPLFDGELDRRVPVTGASGARRSAAAPQVATRVDGPRLCDAFVAIPPCNGAMSQTSDPALRDRVDRVLGNPRPGDALRLTRVADAELADISLFVHGGRIWFVAPLDDYIQSQRLPPALAASVLSDEALAKGLAQFINPIAMARWLYRLGEGSSPPLNLSLRAHRCEALDSAPLNLSGNPRVLHAGQSLCVVIDNQGPAAVDVTLLHLDENYAIDPVFPVRGESNRIDGSQRRTIALEVVADGAASMDRLIALAVPSRPGTVPTDFSWAAQAGVPPDPVTRGTSPDANPVWIRTLRWIASP